MLVTVYQKDWDHDDKLRAVAIVDAPTDNNDVALNDAYAMTQTVHDYWWKNRRVEKVFYGDGAPSTSVGDVLFTSEGWWRVEPFGFAKVDPDELKFYNSGSGSKTVEEIDL